MKVFLFTAEQGIGDVIPDLITQQELHENGGMIDDALRTKGFQTQLSFERPEVAGMTIYTRNDSDSSIGAVTIGTDVEFYAMRKLDDKYRFLRDFVPMVKGLIELHDLTVDTE